MRVACLPFALAVCLLAGCGRKQIDSAEFQDLSAGFVHSSLALSPVTATTAGYHTHAGASLDSQLDDLSAEGIERQRKHWRDWRGRLSSLDAATLDAESKADLEMMIGLSGAALFDLDEEQRWRSNPTLYVELLGNALFTPYSVEYAPEEERWRHIISRLEAAPALFDSARRNLSSSNPVWTRVAIEENEGNLSLIEKEFPPRVPSALRGRYSKAAAAAAAAIRAFNDHLKTVKDNGAGGWRLGREKYARKFRLQLGDSATPEELLAQAEAELTAVRKRMFMLSLPLHVKYYPTHKDPVDLNLIVGEVLGKAARKHVSAGRYFDEARKTLDESRAFLRARADRIVALPERDNLELIETPSFMRGIYSVGGFNPAPALQPELGAFYWLTPIPPDWPEERIESKLREYNDYGLRLLTIHEAIPGHYVQFKYAGRVQSPARRVLRSMFGNGPYVEGWAVYSTELMVREGFMGRNPELELTFLKQLLRAIANTILDIRLHTAGMTDQEALDLMMKRTFQESEEAQAKLQRAKLSSCQLPTYFAGYQAWRQLRAAAEKGGGAAFSPGSFHRKALLEGALPLATLTRLLGLDPGKKSLAPGPANVVQSGQNGARR